MSTGPLSIDVYVAPMRPYTRPDQLAEGEVATWAPSSSTLISGPTVGEQRKAEHDDECAGTATLADTIGTANFVVAQRSPRRRP
jgi:hypothetical protein